MFPVLGERVEPSFDVGERSRIEVVVALTPARFLADQARFAQHLQMLRDGGAANVELLRELRYGPRPSPPAGIVNCT